MRSVLISYKMHSGNNVEYNLLIYLFITPVTPKKCFVNT